MMKTIIRSWLALFGTLCSVGLASAQQTDQLSVSNIFSRLQQYDQLQVEIETNVRQLRTGSRDEAWQPAVFKIMQGKKAVFQQNVQVAARGNMRRKTCEFPPVKIRFFEQAMENDSLEDVNELKLVVGCRNSTVDDQLVLKECLAYELYNLLTEESFRVKLAQVRIKNPGSKRGVESTAFFIESERELATRLGARPLKPRIISPKIMDTLAYDRLCVFEYMIGNTDFSVYSRHNVKVLGAKDRPVLPVPYDFDYSGFVSADYAVPSPGIPIPDVQHRYYMGLCRKPDQYSRVFRLFMEKKPQMLERCQTFPGLNKNSRTHVSKYLESFFPILENPREAKVQIVDNCDKRERKE